MLVVCSDSISSGKKEDKAGKAIISKLETCGVQIDGYVIIPDEQVQIEEQLMQAVNANIDIILFTGGTGLSPRDVTPEAIRPLLDREIPGIMEAARSYGQQRTPLTLSRSLAGMKGNTLVLALPGSTKAARETMDALFPSVLHIFRVLEGAQHF